MTFKTNLALKGGLKFKFNLIFQHMKLFKICLILFDYGNEIRSTYF